MNQQLFINGLKEYDFKCPNCAREFSIKKDIIMRFCPCGYTSEFHIVIEVIEDDI